jgi:hypothetical protein
MAGRLSHLQWDSMLPYELNLASCLASPALLVNLSKLRRLKVCRSTLDDAGMRTLVTSFPELTHVEVGGCQLHNNHLDEVGCSSWEELCIDSTDFASLARLPLRRIKRVRVCALCSAGSSSATVNGDSGFEVAHPEITSLVAALATAPNCAVVCDHCLLLKLHVSEMPALLPLIARWQGVGRLDLRAPGNDPQQLTPAAVKALGALLEALPSCIELHMTGFKPHPSVQLLPVLAGITSVTSIRLAINIITSTDTITEAEVMAWCAGGNAAHPIVVTVTAYGRFQGQPDRVSSTVNVPGSGVQLVWL